MRCCCAAMPAAAELSPSSMRPVSSAGVSET
jgi:hypothetical protein